MLHLILELSDLLPSMLRGLNRDLSSIPHYGISLLFSVLPPCEGLRRSIVHKGLLARGLDSCQRLKFLLFISEVHVQLDYLCVFLIDGHLQIFY